MSDAAVAAAVAAAGGCADAGGRGEGGEDTEGGKEGGKEGEEGEGGGKEGEGLVKEGDSDEVGAAVQQCRCARVQSGGAGAAAQVEQCREGASTKEWRVGACTVVMWVRAQRHGKASTAARWLHAEQWCGCKRRNVKGVVYA